MATSNSYRQHRPAFELKRDDLRPTITHTLRDRSGDVIDLTDANSVRFYMQAPGDDAPRINAEMTITDAEAGRVEYEWQEGDTAAEGQHYAEFVIRWPDGEGGTAPQTIPPRGQYYIHFDTPIGRGDPQDFDGRVDITVGHIEAESGTFGSLIVDGQEVDPSGVAEHDHAGDTLAPDTLNATSVSASSTDIDDLSATGVIELGGVRFWFSDTEPAEAAEDDVWVETNP